MYIKVEPNPDGGPDSSEAKWWKNWLSKKRETHTANTTEINKLKQQQINIQIQQRHEEEELQKLCAKYDRLVKRLSSELCIKHKPDHRRLELE